MGIPEGERRRGESTGTTGTETPTTTTTTATTNRATVGVEAAAVTRTNVTPATRRTIAGPTTGTTTGGPALPGGPRYVSTTKRNTRTAHRANPSHTAEAVGGGEAEAEEDEEVAEDQPPPPEKKTGKGVRLERPNPQIPSIDRREKTRKIQKGN